MFSLPQKVQSVGLVMFGVSSPWTPRMTNECTSKHGHQVTHHEFTLEKTPDFPMFSLPQKVQSIGLNMFGVSSPLNSRLSYVSLTVRPSVRQEKKHIYTHLHNIWVGVYMYIPLKRYRYTRRGDVTQQGARV